MDNKIDKIEVFKVSIPLSGTFVVAIGASDSYDGVLVKVTSGDQYGWGEAGPIDFLTGETQSTVASLFEEIIIPVATGKSIWDLNKVNNDVATALTHNMSAKAALDIALHDLRGKILGQPVCSLLGGRQEKVLTSLTIGIKDLDGTAKQALAYAEQGVKLIKIKIGLNPGEDIERVRAVRKVVGNTMRLYVDANQGYSVKDAIAALNRMEEFNLDWVEQPVHYKNIEGMAEVKRNVGIPVMADESIWDASDALKVIKAGAADMINIKLMKAGGISGGAKIAAVAEAEGIPCMVGAMKETRVGMTAGTHLVNSFDIIRTGDLDGHIMLSEDPVQCGMNIIEGLCTPTEGAGLGLDIDMEKLGELSK